MKVLKLVCLVSALFIAGNMKAQVSINFNIGTAPAWGPVGYEEARYYYLPDVEAYYDIQNSMFIYIGGNGVWIRRAYLPGRYRNYDLYGGYKVVLNDYRGNNPYERFREHRMQYAKGYRGASQRSIGERPGNGHSNQYRGNEGHGDEGDRGHGDHGNSNHGNGNGHGKHR